METNAVGWPMRSNLHLLLNFISICSRLDPSNFIDCINLLSGTDGQVVSVTDCSVNDSGSHTTRVTDCRFSVQCKVIELPLSMMLSLERLSSSSLSVKMVNMP